MDTQFVVSIHVDNECRLLWEELAGVSSWWNLPMYIGGDFNIIRFPSECSRNSRLGTSMTEFFEFIFELSLMDLPLMGDTFTWSKDHTWFKLDTFLVSSEWVSLFQTYA